MPQETKKKVSSIYEVRVCVNEEESIDGIREIDSYFFAVEGIAHLASKPTHRCYD